MQRNTNSHISRLPYPRVLYPLHSISFNIIYEIIIVTGLKRLNSSYIGRVILRYIVGDKHVRTKEL